MSRLLLPSLALIVLFSARSDAAGLYNYTDLGNIYARSINAQGQVAGISGNDSGAVYSGYGPDAGQVASLGTTYAIAGVNAQGQVIGYNPAGYSYLATPSLGAGGPGYTITNLGPVFARGINDLGQVAGDTPSGHAFLDSGGQTTDLGTLGGTRASVAAINAFGQIVGSVTLDPAHDVQHAYLYSGGKTTDLGTLGSSYSAASAINAAGEVTGTSTTASGATHVFVSNNGQMTDIGSFGGASSYASAINSSGQVVGYSETTTGALHAFLYSNGVMEDLNSLIPLPSGWSFVTALGINDAGQVVGEVKDASGVEHGFVLTPAGMAAPTPPTATPEPTTLALFSLAGLGLVARRALRRRAA